MLTQRCRRSRACASQVQPQSLHLGACLLAWPLLRRPRVHNLAAALLGPCPQNSKGVVWGTYMIKVDTLAGLRASRAEIDQIWKQVRRRLPGPPAARRAW